MKKMEIKERVVKKRKKGKKGKKRTQYHRVGGVGLVNLFLIENSSESIDSSLK